MTGEIRSMFDINLTDNKEKEEAAKKLEIENANKKKELAKRYMGMPKEFVSIIGGIPPLVPLNSNKIIDKNKRVTQWVWHGFLNPARKDGLKLFHWQRKEDTEKDYEYAQNNLKINLVEYSDEEYDTLIKDMDLSWTKEETDYFWDLCRNYDLRFIIIHDRYDEGYNRSVEELKNRYYSVCKKLLEARKHYDHPILKSGYNYDQEVKRRACLERIINKTKEESIQENEVINKAMEIDSKIEKFEKVENNLKQLMQETTPVQSFEEYLQNQMINESESFVYLRSQKMKYPLPISEKMQKKIEIILKEMNFPEKLVPTQRVEQTFDLLKNNLIKLIALKKHLDKKQKEKQNLETNFANFQNNKITIPKGNITMASQSSNFPNSNLDAQSIISSQSKDKKRKTNTTIVEPLIKKNSSASKRKATQNEDTNIEGSQKKKRKK